MRCPLASVRRGDNWRGNVQRAEVAEKGTQIASMVDCIDARKQRFKRLHSESFDRFGVGVTGIEVPKKLKSRAGWLLR